MCSPSQSITAASEFGPIVRNANITSASSDTLLFIRALRCVRNADTESDIPAFLRDLLPRADALSQVEGAGRNDLRDVARCLVEDLQQGLATLIAGRGGRPVSGTAAARSR
jgi:hypothetical protein